MGWSASSFPQERDYTRGYRGGILWNCTQSALTLGRQYFMWLGCRFANYLAHFCANYVAHSCVSRKSRTDQGERRIASAQLIEAIEGLALERPPLPISSIHRQACAMAETLKERTPSYWVVRRIVRSLPSGLLMLAHRGNKAYGEGFDLVHRREALKPNSIWQVDHAQLDIKLLRDDGSVGKPWLTIVIDDYSRAVAGYYLGFEPPSSLRTTLALRQGIWRKGDPHWEVCGIPDVLYPDNGSDFRSKHLEQVAADLKIRLVFSTPGQPQVEAASSVSSAQ
jgi:putative transposase